MNEKKNIDKLFKEQFKNFEVAPKDHVWENIEERLHEDKRKKRRVIPIWWKVAGIAAGLILLFTVANQVFNPTEDNGISNETIVEDSNSGDILKSEDKSNTVEQDKNPSEDILKHNSAEQIADTDSKTNGESDDGISVNKHKSKEESQNSNATNSSDSFKNMLKEKRAPLQDPLTKDAVANNSNTTKRDTNSQELIKNKSELDKINESSKSSTNTTVADANTTKASSKTNQNPQNEVKDKSEIDALLKSTKTSTNTTVADVNSKENETTSDIEINTTEDLQNKEKESTNAIENAIAEAEDTDEKEEEEEKLNRWSVSPNVAPVYFSSLGEGSSIDDQFISNSKESDINMSYGIAGSYTINKKLKVRAGINRVDLGYTTNDVLIFENSNENLFARDNNRMPNVDVSASQNRYSIYSSGSFNFENAPATLLTKEKGSLDQQLGFIEVPIEIEYTLVEKKLGVNLIGGFSTLFLNQNDIYAVFNNGERARIGGASNVKDMSYSANFGIGLDYNFSSQWQLNLDPTFKYQINTFNNTSGDFQPFFIGVYTGLSFKF